MPRTNKEAGHIISHYSGVAKVEGLSDVFVHEVLLDSKGKEAGIVIGFDKDFVDVLLFHERASEKGLIFRSKQIFSIKISEKFLGRIVDGLGAPIDDLGKIIGKQIPVFSEAPAIIDREPVNEPLTTGIKIIDATLPLGRGQRELLIGDRKLGKTTLTIDIVLNQIYQEIPVYCIYVFCGKKKSELMEIVGLLSGANAFSYTVVVAATSDSSLASQYLAPFVGCTIGEFFRDSGKDALVIYDDLTKHANVYRDISLLLERAPGREAYPGDIFSLHSKLLERAAKLSKEKMGGSLSAIPIIETQEGDITSFIPTNLISITDGQIYVERGLFQKGFLPAVNVGLSVSRVGSDAQQENLKEVTRGIRLALSQQNELQKLSQLETVMSKEAQKNIFRGKLILEFLKQDKHTFVDWREQSLLFFALENGFFDDVAEEATEDLHKLFLIFIESKYKDLIDAIGEKKIESLKSEIQKAIIDFKEEFLEGQKS